VNVEQVDADRFLTEAEPLLLRDEARHNLLLGLVGNLRTDPDLFPEKWLWLVRDGHEVVGAASLTRPYSLVLAKPGRDAVIDALVESIEEDLPGVVAAVPEVDAFAERWCARHDLTPRVVLGQGIYALRELREIPRAAGSRREATADDLALLLDWFDAFVVEAVPHERGTRELSERQIRQRLDADLGGIALWEDEGEVVSLCGYGSPTPNGIRIGPVYTPLHLRGRGYATTLTADVSAQLLAGGRTFCFLYTDLANPTSNAIYERMGYARVCESRQVAFE
jgi:RimJ/RimL family protein N-acetyltransferase